MPRELDPNPPLEQGKQRPKGLGAGNLGGGRATARWSPSPGSWVDTWVWAQPHSPPTVGERYGPVL